MSENIGVATGKIMLKIVIALFKGVWNVLTFGFRAYKGHRDKKDAEMREQLKQVQANSPGNKGYGRSADTSGSSH